MGKLLKSVLKMILQSMRTCTNVDVAKGGVNDLLAEALGLQNTEVLAPTYAEEMKKLLCLCQSLMQKK